MISDEELNEQIEYLESFGVEFQDVLILLRELRERRKSPQFPVEETDE